MREWNFAEKQCEMCGVTFKPKSGVQKYCSECKKLMARRRSVEFRIREKERKKDVKCCICGGKFGEMIKGKPYCHKHRSWYRQYGAFEKPERVRRITSTIEVEDDLLRIITAKGEVILSDAEDYELIKDKSWYISSHGYAVSRSDNVTVYLHRLVMKDLLDEAKEIDHINGNTLDNRKNNLRVCEHRENLRNLGVQKNNTSGYPGVYENGCGNYRAIIMVDYKTINLGTYPTFEEAVNARIKAENQYHGEFAGHLRREKEQEEWNDRE